MIASIIPFGTEGNGIIICDGKCQKAWGIDQRPKRKLSLEEDDWVYIRDSLLGEAEGGSDTEGGDGHPLRYNCPVVSRHNRWCARACERSVVIFPTDMNKFFEIPNMENPKPNYLKRRG